MTAAVLLIAAAWLFFGVVEDVLSNDPLVQFDQAVYGLLQALRTDWGDQVMVSVTEIGSAAGVIALIATTSLYFVYKRYWHTLGYWLAGASVAEILVWVLKTSLERQRPHNIYTGIEQFSFPSGHTTLSIVVYGFMAFLMAYSKRVKVKIALTLAAATIIILISFSRLYLGVHWFSDVLGSLSLGLMWVALLSIAYTHHVRREQISVLPFSLLVLATLLLVSTFYVGERHASDVGHYAHQSSPKSTVLGNWTATGWNRLPSARSELDGEFEESFSIQWAAPAEAIVSRLAAAGWQSPKPWISKAMLLWLLPRTPIAQLPVLPKFDYGAEQKLTFVKVLSRDERAVIRLWPSAYSVHAAPAASSEPLWQGMASIERLRHISGIVAFVTTKTEHNRALNLLQNDLQHHASVEKRQRQNTGVLLIW